MFVAVVAVAVTMPMAVTVPVMRVAVIMSLTGGLRRDWGGSRRAIVLVIPVSMIMKRVVGGSMHSRYNLFYARQVSEANRRSLLSGYLDT
jgi:hypothetical protein